MDNNSRDTSSDKVDENPMMRKARSMHSASISFLDGSLRKKVEKNVAHFNNKHAKGSKFALSSYRNRNKMFHPKTRNGVRSNEASFAAAMFSTSDLVSVTAVDENDPAQKASAEIHQELLNYRLEKSIKWFLTSVGAFQEAHVYGIVASYNHWKYKERTTKESVLLQDDEGNTFTDPETNEQLMTETEVVEVITDEPAVDLIPFENIRFDAAADWRDPINTSPYVIRDVPMYACDIITEMGEDDPKTGAPRWNRYSLEQLISANQDKDDDSTRRARNTDKNTDPTDSQEIDEYKTIWLRQYFVREKGEEIVFWTVGDSLMLADPIPLDEAYLQGERPITLGICVLEAHKAYPTSPVELNNELQERANSLINQRADNVDLVLNKRYYIRRGAKIDTQALMRNTPGGGVLMDNITQDIRTESTPDITSSSYAEQDRLDISMDEAAGVFSQSSVQNNRALNETVGGMEMMNTGASAISEYTIRTFVETWVEPTLRQLVKLEAAYETDETILALAAGKTDLFQQYGQDLSLDKLLNANLTVRVNVGMGATSPQQKLDRLRTSVMTVGQIAPGAISRIKEEEIIKEVFGAAGYKDGSRFFENKEDTKQQDQPQDPMIAIKQQELQIKQQGMKQDTEIKQQTIEFEQQLQQMRIQDGREKWMAELALKEKITVEALMQRTGLEREKLQTTRQVAAGKITNDQTKLQLQAENLSQNHDTF